MHGARELSNIALLLLCDDCARSIYAERALCRRLAPHLRARVLVLSAGLFTSAGDRLPLAWVRLAAERGLDLTDEQPCADFDAARDLCTFDLVLCMDARTRERVLEQGVRGADAAALDGLAPDAGASAWASASAAMTPTWLEVERRVRLFGEVARMATAATATATAVDDDACGDGGDGGGGASERVEESIPRWRGAQRRNADDHGDGGEDAQRQDAGVPSESRMRHVMDRLDAACAGVAAYLAATIGQ